MDRGVGRLQSTVSQSQTWLKWLSMQWCMRDSFLPELTSICIDISFYFNWSGRYAVIALVVLICIFLIVKDANHFFICLFAIYILSEAILSYWRIQIFCLSSSSFFFFFPRLDPASFMCRACSLQSFLKPLLGHISFIFSILFWNNYRLREVAQIAQKRPCAFYPRTPMVTCSVDAV